MDRKTVQRRKVVRLTAYDYTTAAAYFVTVCVQGRSCELGDLSNDTVRLSEIGEIVHTCWWDIKPRFANVELDEYVIMPNHIHGIIILREDVGAGFPRLATRTGNDTVGGDPSRTQGAETAPLRKPTLGQVIAYFKYQSTKRINLVRGSSGLKFWQRNYHEHVIRGEQDLRDVRAYIRSNPHNWDSDPERLQNEFRR